MEIDEAWSSVSKYMLVLLYWEKKSYVSKKHYVVDKTPIGWFWKNIHQFGVNMWWFLYRRRRFIDLT